MAGIDEFLPTSGKGISPFTGGISPFIPMPDYAELIRETAREFGIDPEQAVTLAKFESNLNPTARSSAGAYGLMQVMPGSAGGMDLSNPSQNVRRGIQLWKEALQKSRGNPQVAYRQYYNPGYTGVGPFPTSANVSTPSSQAPPPPQIHFTPLPTFPPTPQPRASGFGQFLHTLANALGIRQIGELSRSAGRALSSEETEIQRHPGKALLDFLSGEGPLGGIPRMAAEAYGGGGPGGLGYTAGGAAEELAGRLAGQAARRFIPAIRRAKPVPIPAPITPQAIVPNAAVQRQLPLTTTVQVPGGLGAAVEQRLPRRTTVRQMQPGVPVRTPTKSPFIQTPPPTPPTIPAPISFGEPGMLARATIPESIRAARRADDYARGTMAAQAGRQARSISTYLSQDYKTITPDQHRQLFYSMFTPDSPVVTGKWPDWVSPRLQTSLTESYRRTQEAYASLRNLTPEQRKFLLGEGDTEDTPYFPLISAKHAIERSQVGALGHRRLHRVAGGLKTRDFYSLHLPDGTSAPGMIQGQDLFRWEDGKWNKIGTITRKAPGQIVETPLGQVRINPANPLELKQAGIHEYVENAFQSLFEREDDLTTALNIRQLMEHWKIDPQFRSIIAPPGSAIRPGWKKAPWLGEDYYVEPHLADIANRLGGLPAGNPARLSLLNNWSLNISFGLWPFSHYRNMIFNWLFPATRLLGLTRPDLFAKAFRDVNEISPEYIRYMERGGATHYLDIQRRRILESALDGLRQNPRATPILQGAENMLGSYQNWQQAVNWKMDAILTMQAVRYFQNPGILRRGLPLDKAIDLAIKRIPQYYVPAVFAAPRGFQKAADVARYIAQDSRMIVFNPFHFSQAKNLQTALGIQGFKTLAALVLVDQVIWPKMEGALQHSLVGYYTRKGDLQAARKAQRVHITTPGLGRIVEGTRTASQMLADVLRSAPPGSKLSEGGFELKPALGTFGRSLVTASPELQTILAGFNLLRGQDPNLENLLPFGTIQEGVRMVTGQASPLEAGMSFTGTYPRYYLPLEFQAMQVRNALPKVASRIYAMRNSGQEQQADQLLRQVQTHIYTLNRAAVYDLQRHGFRIDDPTTYATTLTEAELTNAGLFRKPRFRLHPRRPSLAPSTPELAPQ